MKTREKIDSMLEDVRQAIYDDLVVWRKHKPSEEEMEAFADAFYPLENDIIYEVESRWEEKNLVDPQPVQQEQQQS